MQCFTAIVVCLIRQRYKFKSKSQHHGEILRREDALALLEFDF